MSHLNDLKAMETVPAEGNWMERLRKGNWVWLPKEQQFASVAWPYEPPEPGTCAGRISLDRYEKIDGQFHYRGQQTWYVCNGGAGFDGQQLIMPCEGQLPDNPEPLPEVEVRQIHRELSALRTKNLELEAKNMLLGRAYLAAMEKIGNLTQKIESVETDLANYKEEVKARLSKKKIPTVKQVAADMADLAIKSPKTKKSEPSAN